jgi:hypothetical protein
MEGKRREEKEKEREGEGSNEGVLLALLLLVQEKVVIATTTTAIIYKSDIQTATTNAQRHDTATQDSPSPSQMVVG